MRRAAVFVFRLTLGVVVVAFGIWATSTVAVLAFAAGDQARRADAIVVLGAAQYAGKPSPVLKARLDHGVDLWRSGVARRMIVTGGVGAGDTTSEAAVARRYVSGHGIPPDSVLVETHGRTTSESMRAVAGIMESRGLRRAVLVSDPFHMLRLWILARKNGFVGFTSPTRTSPIEPNRQTRWRYILNESVKAPLAVVVD